MYYEHFPVGNNIFLIYWIPISLNWRSPSKNIKYSKKLVAKFKRFVHVLKGYINSIISGSFADTSVKYLRIVWNICERKQVSTELHAVIQNVLSLLRSNTIFYKTKNRVIQIMINAAIVVNLVIYKLLMS